MVSQMAQNGGQWDWMAVRRKFPLLVPLPESGFVCASPRGKTLLAREGERRKPKNVHFGRSARGKMFRLAETMSIR